MTKPDTAPRSWTENEFTSWPTMPNASHPCIVCHEPITGCRLLCDTCKAECSGEMEEEVRPVDVADDPDDYADLLRTQEDARH